VTIDDKTAAIRLLIRRHIYPRDVQEQDRKNADRISKRGFRGNISLQQGNVQTEEDLDRERQAYREKRQGKQ
jgi:hypothetical protein